MISVLIPAYNEEQLISETISSLRAIATGKSGFELIVIDDGSTDETAAKAEAAGADTVYRQAHGGKGAALRAGAEIASGEILLLIDADLGTSACEADKLLEPVLSGVADMSIATFPIRTDVRGGAGLAVGLARWGIQRLTGRVMQAPLSGQRALRRDVVSSVGGFMDGWGVEIALTVSALRLGYRVLEVPTGMTHRVTGRSLRDVLHRAAQFAAAVGVLWRLWRAKPPLGCQ